MSDARPAVLVVDDTPDNIELISSILSERYVVKAAIRGELALRVAERQPPPDLILLDVEMPGMDGFEVCQRLKAEPLTAGIPVVFLTGSDSAAARQRGMELGAVAYLTRPVDATDLKQTIADILESTV